MNYQPNFLDELFVDHFCGGGGASTGIELATGRIVDVAVNHDSAAIGMHEQNHPYTRHYLKDVFEVDPREATYGRTVGLMWLSPDCTHFSKAKGGTPVKKSIRGLAWLAVKWAAAVRPRVIILENVPEILTWCPLTKDNRPDKRKQYKVTRIADGRKVVETHGTTFDKFVAKLTELGYTVDWRKLSADDYGTGTTRERLYLIARCDGRPIVFPKATHGDGAGLLPKVPASKFIDFSLRGKSIFGRKKPLATATLKRIARGLDKFTIRNPKPFLINVQFNNGGRDADEPLQTICGVRKDYIVNPAMTPFVMCNNNGNVGSAADEPLHTVTGGNRHYWATAQITKYYGGGYDGNGSGADEPLHTITCEPRHYVTETKFTPYIVPTGYGEALGQLPRVNDINAPLGTIVSSGKHNNAAPVLSPFITSRYGERKDGQPPGRTIDKPLPTITAEYDHDGIIAANFIQYHSEQSGSDNRAYPVDAPINVIDTNPRYGLVGAHITKCFSGGFKGSGSDLSKPLGAVTAQDHNGLVSGNLCVFRKNYDCKPLTEPLPTVTAHAHFAKIKTYLTKYAADTPVGNWPEIRELLNTYAGYKIAADEILIIAVDGVPYFISDIEMRMLTPRELYGCQGFPPDYNFTTAKIDGKTVPLTQTEQIRKVGNSVCPPVARALVAANLPEYALTIPPETMKDLLAEVCA